ncbi:MAG: DNA-3-methyladenine glycosylase [Anaerolineae bacterium]
MPSEPMRLGREFYEQDTLTVAKELLGQRLVRVMEDGERLAGIIVETEAYIGEDDQACHAFHGRTPRNAVMYGPAGFAYIYFIYGMYFCLNVVTEREDFPAAVLIRAIEPVEGIARMQALRQGRPLHELTNGPGKLCQALAIDRSLNGCDLCTSPWLFIESARQGELPIATSRRIGVRGDVLARERPWRFFLPANPFVSHQGRLP